MCARWSTIVMSKLFFGFERSFGRCMAVMSCALGWCVCDLTCFQVMWHLVRWFVVLLRYYSVLQRTTTYYSSTTPTYYSNVLLRTTTYYSRTTLYHKVLLCTTKYYSSTTLYYKVLCQYYKVLRQLHAPSASETFPVRSWRRFCIVKYNISRSGYFPKCHEVLRLPRRVPLQPHQILRLPHKINVTNDPHHICNVISNAWSKVRIARTWPNTAPATQNECQQWSASHMKRHFQCVEQVKSPSNLTRYCACHEIWSRFQRQLPEVLPPIERRFDENPRIIRPYPKIKSSSRTRGFGDLPGPILETILYCKIQHLALRLSPKMSRSAAPATKSFLQPHQILRLPHEINVINDPHHICNVISNAWSKVRIARTWPNTAPATQNECQQWSASHMNRHFLCVEQVKSPSNLTRYCACHEIWSRFQRQLPEVLPPIERRFDENPRIIRPYPKIKSSSRTRGFGDLPGPILETILYCKIQHLALRLFPKMSRSAAPATKSHPPTSPNTAPATQNQCHQRSACYLTELLLVTLLNCYSTELLLYWTVTLLNCDSTELWS